MLVKTKDKIKAVLNLSEGFNPLKIPIKKEIKYEAFTFNGGEPHIRLEGFNSDHYADDVFDVTITHRITEFNDLGLLLVAVDALKRSGIVNEIYLVLPYFPGARQDRAQEGEALTSKIYADIINSLNLNEVVIVDPHSHVVSALLNNVTVIDNLSFVIKAFAHIESNNGSVVHLISPDAGAHKKSLQIAKTLEVYNLVKCDKERDTHTGELTGFEVYYEDLNGKDCVIVDDICDGGGTFIGLAKKLKKKNAGNIYLVVSHGIFSKGFRELNKYFKGIYTTNSFPNIDDDKFSLMWDNQFGKVTQIPIQLW